MTTDPRVEALLAYADTYYAGFLIQRGVIDRDDLEGLVAALDRYDREHALEPAESMALTVAVAQVRRGDVARGSTP